MPLDSLCFPLFLLFLPALYQGFYLWGELELFNLALFLEEICLSTSLFRARSTSFHSRKPYIASWEGLHADTMRFARFCL